MANFSLTPRLVGRDAVDVGGFVIQFHVTGQANWETQRRYFTSYIIYVQVISTTFMRMYHTPLQGHAMFYDSECIVMLLTWTIVGSSVGYGWW